MISFQIVQILGSKMTLKQPLIELKLRQHISTTTHIDYQIRNILIIYILETLDSLLHQLTITPLPHIESNDTWPYLLQPLYLQQWKHQCLLIDLIIELNRFCLNELFIL